MRRLAKVNGIHRRNSSAMNPIGCFERMQKFFTSTIVHFFDFMNNDVRPLYAFQVISYCPYAYSLLSHALDKRRKIPMQL